MMQSAVLAVVKLSVCSPVCVLCCAHCIKITGDADIIIIIIIILLFI